MYLFTYNLYILPLEKRLQNYRTPSITFIYFQSQRMTGIMFSEHCIFLVKSWQYLVYWLAKKKWGNAFERISKDLPHSCLYSTEFPQLVNILSGNATTYYSTIDVTRINKRKTNCPSESEQRFETIFSGNVTGRRQCFGLKTVSDCRNSCCLVCPALLEVNLTIQWECKKNS